MRADRLLTIILMLQRHQKLTAQQLADTLGVSERTIYRDIDALSIVGVPVYTRSGPDGGCFMDEAYRTSLNWFTGAELQTLLFTGSASPLTELGMQQATDNAVLKLLALLPERYKQEAEKMRHRLYLDPSGWYNQHENHPNLPLLKEAIWNDLLISIQYENWEGNQQQRVLAPYSLVYKADRWYLVAQKAHSEQMRTYRVHRISDVQLQTKHFERDANFDIVEYWQTALELFHERLPVYPVRVKVRPAAMEYFKNSMYRRYEVISRSTDWWTLDLQFTVFEEARTAILGLGVDVQVIEPQALQIAVIEQAQAIVDHWGSMPKNL